MRLVPEQNRDQTGTDVNLRQCLKVRLQLTNCLLNVIFFNS